MGVICSFLLVAVSTFFKIYVYRHYTYLHFSGT